MDDSVDVVVEGRYHETVRTHQIGTWTHADRVIAAFCGSCTMLCMAVYMVALLARQPPSWLWVDTVVTISLWSAAGVCYWLSRKGRRAV